jgi:hypothetical protein
MALVLEHFPRNLKTLSSNSSTDTKKRKEMKERGKEERNEGRKGGKQECSSNGVPGMVVSSCNPSYSGG